jgi:hypothetical protein
MSQNSPFIEEAAKIAASQKMSPVPKVRRGKTPLGIQKLIDSSQKPSEKLGGFRDLTILRKKKPVSAKEQLERDKADHLTRKWLDAGQSYPDPMSPPEKLAVPAALIEGLTGAGIGAGLGALSAARKPKEERGKTMRRRALIGGAGGALVGLGAGAHLRERTDKKEWGRLHDTREAINAAEKPHVHALREMEDAYERHKRLPDEFRLPKLRFMNWSGAKDHQGALDNLLHMREEAAQALDSKKTRAFGRPDKNFRAHLSSLVGEAKSYGSVKPKTHWPEGWPKEAGIGVNAASRLGFENRAPGAKTRTPLRRLGRALVTSPRAQGAAAGLAVGAYGVHKVKQMLDQHQENRQRQQQMQQHQAAMAHYQKQAAARAMLPGAGAALGAVIPLRHSAMRRWRGEESPEPTRVELMNALGGSLTGATLGGIASHTHSKDYKKQAAATAYEKILKATESTRPYALSAGAGAAGGLGAHEFLRGEGPATLKGRLLWGGVGAGAGLLDRKLREDAKKKGLSKEAEDFLWRPLSLPEGKREALPGMIARENASRAKFNALWKKHRATMPGADYDHVLSKVEADLAKEAGFFSRKPIEQRILPDHPEVAAWKKNDPFETLFDEHGGDHRGADHDAVMAKVEADPRYLAHKRSGEGLGKKQREFQALLKEAFASSVDGRMNGMAGVKRPQFPTKGSTAVQMKQLNSLQTPNPKPTPTNNQQASVPRPGNVIPG